MRFFYVCKENFYLQGFLEIIIIMNKILKFFFLIQEKKKIF